MPRFRSGFGSTTVGQEGGLKKTSTAVVFEPLEHPQDGDVMHCLWASLEDEPFHGLCCRARQGRTDRPERHNNAIRELLVNTLAECTGGGDCC